MTQSFQYLVTGTGRCGTTFMSEWMSHYGFHLTHDPKHLDQMGNSGCASWFQAAHRHDPSEYFWCDDELPRFDHVIHVVRHPLLVIGSFLRSLEPSQAFWKFTGSVVGSEAGNPHARLGRFWLHWNRMCLDISSISVPITNLHPLTLWLDVADRPSPVLPNDIVPKWRGGAKSFARVPLSWDELANRAGADLVRSIRGDCLDAYGIDP